MSDKILKQAPMSTAGKGSSSEAASQRVSPSSAHALAYHGSYSCHHCLGKVHGQQPKSIVRPNKLVVSFVLYCSGLFQFRKNSEQPVTVISEYICLHRSDKFLCPEKQVCLFVFKYQVLGPGSYTADVLVQCWVVHCHLHLCKSKLTFSVLLFPQSIRKLIIWVTTTYTPSSLFMHSCHFPFL